MTRLPRCLRHRAPALWLLLPLALGLILGRSLPGLPPPLGLLAGGTILAGLALVRWPRPWLWPVLLCLGLTLIGCGYYAARRHRLADWDRLPAREARLVLRVDRVFAPKPGARSFSGLACIVDTDTHLRDLVGQKLYFSAARPKDGGLPVRSAWVAVTGVLSTVPVEAPVDSFEGYLANQGLNFRLDRARLTSQVRPPGVYRAFCERTVERMSSLLGVGVAPKRPALTAILRAMMLGQKNDLTGDQQALFMHSGTMHLFAINGLHIGVVAIALHLTLALLRVPRLAATFLTLAVLWLDVDTTGASPSAVRAFLLVASFELAYVLRRRGNGLAALSNAAVLVLIFDPMALFSASFEMSYGVAFSILAFGMPLADYLRRRWQPYRALPKISWTPRHHAVRRAFEWAANALAIGWSATLVSAVTGIQFFNVFVPGALAANLVLVPLASLVIASGFISLAGGLSGAAAVSFWFNHAAVLVLWGIDGLIRFSSRLPGAWVAAHWRWPWVGPCALAALFVSCLAGYAWSWRRRRGGFWPPAALVALVLLFGVKFGP